MQTEQTSNSFNFSHFLRAHFAQIRSGKQWMTGRLFGVAMVLLLGVLLSGGRVTAKAELTITGRTGTETDIQLSGKRLTISPYEDMVITQRVIDKTGIYTITGTDADECVLVNAPGQVITLVLSDAVIDVSDFLEYTNGWGKYVAALQIQAAEKVIIELSGTNKLKSGRDHAGLENGVIPIEISMKADADTGALEATGGDSGAGIGGGDRQDGAKITIQSGTVTAQGGEHAAGIGGSRDESTSTNPGGTGKNITIKGGMVTATGGNYGFGIGGSEGSVSAGDILIQGGILLVKGQNVADIGPEPDGDLSCGKQTGGIINWSALSSRDSITAGGGIAFNGSADTWVDYIYWYADSLIISSDMTIPTGLFPNDTFVIPSGKTLNIEKDKTLTLEEGVTIQIEGSLLNSGNLINQGTITNTGTIQAKAGSTYTGNAVSGNPITSDIKSVSIAQKPSKLEYLVGEDLNTAGLQLEVEYDWGDPKNISTGFTTSGYDKSKAGEQTITVTYEGKTATFDVTVHRQYQVLFNLNGHGTAIEKQLVREGQKVTKPTDPAATGYTFDGWFQDQACTKSFNFTTAISADTTLYAKWTKQADPNKPDEPNKPDGPDDPGNTGDETVGGFTDVPANKFYAQAVLWAVENGITSGTSKTTFSPDATCTRGQCVTFLYRTARETAEPDNRFIDVPKDKFYAAPVAWAVAKGITSGTSATTFSPDATCTRGQIVTFLWRKESCPEPASAGSFADVAEDKFYARAVAWAVEKGITSGTSATTFSPGNPCTRGQIVTFLWRAFK